MLGVVHWEGVINCNFSLFMSGEGGGGKGEMGKREEGRAFIWACETLTTGLGPTWTTESLKKAL